MDIRLIVMRPNLIKKKKPLIKSWVQSYLTTHTHTHTYRERETCVIPEVFEDESFPLKDNPTTFEYKIHSGEVDLYYLKYL